MVEQNEKLFDVSAFYWNVLADKNCTQKNFPSAPSKALSWAFRQKLIVQNLLSSQDNKELYDINILTQVDKPQLFIDVFNASHYLIYNQRNGLDFQKDGVFLALSKKKFNLIEKQFKNFVEKDKVEKEFLSLTKLKMKSNPDQQVWVFAGEMPKIEIQKDMDEAKKAELEKKGLNFHNQVIKYIYSQLKTLQVMQVNRPFIILAGNFSFTKEQENELKLDLIGDQNVQHTGEEQVWLSSLQKTQVVKIPSGAKHEKEGYLNVNFPSNKPSFNFYFNF